jgi:inosine-uridine nucleoside N-ribohydrolase
MVQKVIIDCDPGIDDAVALAIALFDPRLEVVAVTACSGTVDAHRSTQNVQAIIEQLDPPKHPRIGAASDPDDAPVTDGTEIHGADGLGNIGLQPMGRQHVMSSEKLIADRLRAEPGQISILCLGPSTGIARAFQRDNTLAELVHRLYLLGGCKVGQGDVTAAAEFNMHFDPIAASYLLKSLATKTLLPLEQANEVAFGLDLIDHVPPKYTRVGKLLHSMLPHLFRTLRQKRAQETISLPGAVAIMALLEPSYFTTEEATVEVEVHGELTRGATIVDQRPMIRPKKNVELITSVDAVGIRDQILRSIKFAGQES